MNNLFSFWLAPITALFYPRVYRDAVKASMARGVFYMLYLSGITIVLFFIFLTVFLAPQGQKFVDWTKTNMPVLIWTPEGLSLENGQKTHTMNFPDYGPVIIFDMTKETVTDTDIGKAFVFVTAKKVFLKRAPGQIEARDITAAGMQSKQQLPARVRIDDIVVQKLYQNVKNVIFTVLPIIFFFVFFLGGLVGVLVWSLAGLLFNQMRKNKLGYEAIFNLICFALTASFVSLWLTVRWPWFVGVLINLAYMVFAFKVTDQEPEPTEV